jgi:hypothetical protein
LPEFGGSIDRNSFPFFYAQPSGPGGGPFPSGKSLGGSFELSANSSFVKYQGAKGVPNSQPPHNETKSNSNQPASLSPALTDKK